MPPPFTLRPAAPACPVLVSVTHAGRAYPASLLGAARVERRILEQLEDPWVDELAAGAAAAGAGLLVAQVPRAFVDMNRAPDDLEPGAVSGAVSLRPTARARAGLGVVPTRLPGTGPLWRRPVSPGDFRARIEGAHAPFHAALAAELARIVRAHGAAVLLDLHSMPALSDGTAVVVGNRHGASCAPEITEAALGVAARHGLSAAANAPYAGGYVVERHGDPLRGVHAVQVELARPLYLDAAERRPGPGWGRIGAFVTALAEALADAVRPSDWLQAAE